MRNLFRMGLVLLLGSGIAAAVLSRRQSHASPTAVGPPGVAEVAENNLALRVAAMEAENVRVRGELALVRAAAENVQAASLPKAAAFRSESEEASRKQIERTNLRSRQATAMAAYEQELEARAATEDPDRAWASVVENVVRAKLATLKHPVVFQSAHCGSSFCSAVVEHEHSRAHLDLLTELRTHSAPGVDGQILMRRHPNPGGGYRTTLYLSKAGERLPALDEALAAR